MPADLPLFWAWGLSAAIAACLTVGIVLAVWEWRWLGATGRRSAAVRRETGLSLSTLLPNGLLTWAAVGPWGAVYLAAAAWAPWHLPLNGWVLALAVVATDFSYYWEHRCAHRVAGLWRLYHGVHHTGATYTVATAYRVSCLNQLLAPAFYLPWVLLGLHPALALALQLLVFHYQAWLHTELIGPLGVLDRLFNTPANHRIHHSAALAHRDRNLGAVFMLWDHLFGTYAAPEPGLRYGIPGVPAPQHVRSLYTAPWHMPQEATPGKPPGAVS